MSSSLKNKKDSIMTQSSMGAQSVEPTFYWYDYETFGVDPRKDRPAQFAGRRTRLDFSPLSGDIGEIFYCRPTDDQLPNPESCLLTGITPQCCAEKGVCESEFADLIWERLNTPGTVSIGYNTLGFDDEVNRFLFWRNFLDPYTHSWAKGCSRWDLFPVVCAAWALRGDTIKWPRWEDIDPIKYPKAEGRKGVCFKLEFLTKANGIEHGHAHDALSDVEATIGMAKLLAEREPKLWRWAFENRTTAKVSAAVADMKPVVWVTPKFGIARGCTGIVACFFQEKHDCWMWDLSFDPTVLQSLSYEEIKQRLFPSIEERAQGIERLPIRRMLHRLFVQISKFSLGNGHRNTALIWTLLPLIFKSLRLWRRRYRPFLRNWLQNGALTMLQRQAWIQNNLFILDLRAVGIRRDLFRSAA